jgi:hypothetical protein
LKDRVGFNFLNDRILAFMKLLGWDKHQVRSDEPEW